MARETMVTPRRRPLLASTGMRALAALAVAVSSGLGVPGRAGASVIASDRIAGVAVSTSSTLRSAAPDVSARSGSLIASDGTLLWTRSSITRRPMASTTKVMTALLVLERCRLDETVTVTKAASGVDYALGLKTGEKRSVRQLLELALVASSNDAANALAVHVAGSTKSFAAKMNERAARLGLRDTHYVNAHGLDAKGHHTSARDLDRLIKVAMTKGEFRRIVSMRSVKLPAYKNRPARTYKSTDKLLGEVPGLLGGKTGFTDDAKYCFVGQARRDGITLTSVVLGSSSSTHRFSSSKRLLEWGFRHYRIRPLASTAETIGAVALADNPARRMPVRFGSAKSLPVLDLLGPVTRRPSLEASVALPIFAGERLGTVTLAQAGKALATVDAVAATSTASAEETVGVVPVAGYVGRTVIAKASATSGPVQRFDTARPVEKMVALDAEVTAPVALGQRIGTITYRQDGSVVATVAAVAAEAIEAPGPLARLEALVVETLRRAVGG